MDSGGENANQIGNTGERRVVRLEGPLDIAHAAGLRFALLEALEASGAEGGTLIDLSGVTAVDLCGLQLLCSAHRSFAGRGGAIGFEERPEWFQQASAAAGFAASTQACGSRLCQDCLWRE